MEMTKQTVDGEVISCSGMVEEQAIVVDEVKIMEASSEDVDKRLGESIEELYVLAQKQNVFIEGLRSKRREAEKITKETKRIAKAAEKRANVAEARAENAEMSIEAMEVKQKRETEQLQKRLDELSTQLEEQTTSEALIAASNKRLLHEADGRSKEAEERAKAAEISIKTMNEKQMEEKKEMQVVHQKETEQLQKRLDELSEMLKNEQTRATEAVALNIKLNESLHSELKMLKAEKESLHARVVSLLSESKEEDNRNKIRIDQLSKSLDECNGEKEKLRAAVADLTSKLEEKINVATATSSAVRKSTKKMIYLERVTSTFERVDEMSLDFNLRNESGNRKRFLEVEAHVNRAAAFAPTAEIMMHVMGCQVKEHTKVASDSMKLLDAEWRGCAKKSRIRRELAGTETQCYLCGSGRLSVDDVMLHATSTGHLDLMNKKDVKICKESIDAWAQKMKN